MWGIVFGWAFISTIVVVLIGIGFSAMSMNPPPYILAKACFSLAAVILSVRLGWWLASEENSRISRSQAIIFAFVIFGLIGAFWIWSLKWVIERGRSDRFGEQHASVAPAIMQTTNQSSSELPNFKLSLLGGNVFIPGQDQNLTGIVLKVRIRNAGTPSIATDWKLFIAVADIDHPVAAQITQPPQVLTLSGEKSGRIILHASDFSLEKNASQKPLQIGHPPVEGSLLFYAPIPKEKVIAPDTVIELKVDDFSGHRFSVKQKMGDWLQR